MKYQQFGPSGVSISRVTLGAMDFPNKMRSDEARRVIDEAIDHGVNVIDTADSYGNSQKVIGRVLSKAQRNRVFVATKVHRQLCRDRHAARCSRVNIIDSLDRSLAQLRVDDVDLFQLHHPDPQTPLDETLRALDDLVKAGKTRYIGLSNHYAWHVAWTVTEAKRLGLTRPISLQAGYSLLYRQPEREVAPMLEKLNLGYMVYGPLSRGLLAGKFHDDQGRLTVDPSQRKLRPVFGPVGEVDRLDPLVQELRRSAESLQLTAAQLAIAWILSRPWVTTVLVGGSSPQRFPPMYAAADAEVPPEVIERLDELSAHRAPEKYHNKPFAAGPGLPAP